MFNFGSYFSYDSLTIYDGGSMSSDLVGKFCGNSLPPGQIFSSSQELLMHFQTNHFGIYDGGSTSSELVGKFCGNSLPPSQILSSSNELLLHFETNSVGTYNGFHIEYSSLCKSHRFILFVANKSNSISFKFKLVQMDI